ncbi:hypothetical protein Pint_28036 [Pistacia integerrima]|uniref:Uncharacterized protein n=1 Tax=Pistacia integerrima TaxID=434235 RepID=A0ACC0YPX1_9ROSI|nr:hypothetical protein Pint_28036 [Pistacia integerrima]
MIYISLSPKVQAQVDEANLKLMTETIEWPLSMPHVYEESLDENEEEDSLEDDEEVFWHTMKYYISYGALAANRIPCPPRSGRSYYTHNCYKARGPAHPYTRGCSSITRCRR